ncbi:hypothetical protein Sango_0237300 [Sesamum angolense]|uniref:S-protein homolog n=1 Tax=Sesamum angolense TaxID=2727404 RepID=A0AAE1XHU6_9LAMI|nr:hypothetical protein Sango_0237300 [Sesamum angolense]
MRKYEVHVVNNLPERSPSLFVHCASKDQELINSTLSVHADYNWHFTMKFGATTIFFCRFWWGSKDKSFEVFNSKISYLCDWDGEIKDGICAWSVQEDGFYFANQIQPRGLRKMYGWT